LITTVALKAPVVIAMLSLSPFYFLLFKYIADLIGLSEFCRSYGFKLRPRDIAIFSVGFLPYQMLLNISALRAVVRHIRGDSNWEKTTHTGAHRVTRDRFQPQPGTAMMRGQEVVNEAADD
jgi:hypothetical protein